MVRKLILFLLMNAVLYSCIYLSYIVLTAGYCILGISRFSEVLVPCKLVSLISMKNTSADLLLLVFYA